MGGFLDGRLTLGQAANLAALPCIAFLDELGLLRIPMPYDQQDLASDLQTLRVVFPGQTPPKS